MCDCGCISCICVIKCKCFLSVFKSARFLWFLVYAWSQHFLSHISVWDMHTSWVKGLVSVDDMTYWLSDSNDKNMDPHFPKSGHCTSRRNREITSPQSLHYLSLCLPLVSLIKLFTDSFANTVSGLSVAHTNVCAHFHTQQFSRIVIFAPHVFKKPNKKYLSALPRLCFF